jgi:hypothetical protein
MCGYAKDLNVQKLSIGGATDWYFHHPLWLQTPCCGHVLWAYNAEHLTFLETHIQAKLRERQSSPQTNHVLASRLPLWMMRGRNRNDVLKAITRLKALLE